MPKITACQLRDAYSEAAAKHKVPLKGWCIYSRYMKREIYPRFTYVAAVHQPSHTLIASMSTLPTQYTTL